MSKAGLQLFQLGISHQKAPLEVREKISTEGEKREALLGSLRTLSGLDEFLLLNTCNRVEIYGVGGDHVSAEVVAHFCRIHAMDSAEFSRYGEQLCGESAVRHIMEVASGLDSQMLGETEIFGQVKQAYEAAGRDSTLGPVLHKLFQKAFHAAKWVRTHTDISRGQVSIGNVAADLAGRIFGNLKRSRILLIGTGEVGEKTAQALVSRGARTVAVTSRTAENAQRLALAIGGEAVLFDTFANALHDYDIIIGSTAAPDFVLTLEDVNKALGKRRTRPLFLIDLALPRDIDPDSSGLQNVFLYNLDDLSGIANENLRSREAEAERSRNYIEDKAARLWESLQ